MRIILADLGSPQVGVTVLFEDNQTCVKIDVRVYLHPLHACSTYLDARCHWLREQVAHDKALRLVYGSTLDQAATASPSRFHGTMSGLYRILNSVLVMGALASHWLRPIPYHCSLMCEGVFWLLLAFAFGGGVTA
jgi:hypothetical protein